MKSCIKKILGGMSLTCILVMSSCNDDAQLVAGDEALPENVPASVYENFRSSFPEAVDVTWAVDGEYAVATFTAVSTRSAAGKTSVWYGLKDAKKKMQSQTVGFEMLPEAVRDAFAGSEYAEWTPQPAAGLLTRYAAGTVESIYVLRATGASEGAAAKESTLYYTADGVLVKSSVETVYDESYRDLDADYRDWLPQTPPDYVAAFVNSNYPEAAYLYIYVGREVTKVKILDGRNTRQLLFDASGNWLSTQTQLHAEELPDAVLAAFRSSDYADCRIDNAEEYQTADGAHYYLLTVKDCSGKKHEIRIDGDGTSGDEGDEDTPALPDTDGEGNEDDGNDDGYETDNGTGYLAKSEIDAFVLQRYPNAAITDRDYDEKGLEVELSYNGTKITVVFDLCPQGYVWTGSEWDLDIRHASAIPAPIRETVDGSYAGYQLYFLKYIETASGSNYYEAGLKSAQLKQDIKVKMDEQGNVLAEYGKH